MRLRAEYQFLRGDYKAAGDRAMAFLDNPDAQPRDPRLINREAAERRHAVDVEHGFGRLSIAEGSAAEGHGHVRAVGCNHVAAGILDVTVTARGIVLPACAFGGWWTKASFAGAGESSNTVPSP